MINFKIKQYKAKYHFVQIKVKSLLIDLYGDVFIERV